MLDYKFIKDNLQAVKDNIKNRNMVADADIVVKLYDERTSLTTSLQALQQKRNQNADAMKQKLDNETRQKYIAEGKAIKDQIADTEKKLAETETELETAARKIPNMANPEAPIGKVDTENLEVKKVGTPRVFDFPPKDHEINAAQNAAPARNDDTTLLLHKIILQVYHKEWRIQRGIPCRL